MVDVILMSNAVFMEKVIIFSIFLLHWVADIFIKISPYSMIFVIEINVPLYLYFASLSPYVTLHALVKSKVGVKDNFLETQNQ